MMRGFFNLLRSRMDIMNELYKFSRVGVGVGVRVKWE